MAGIFGIDIGFIINILIIFLFLGLLVKFFKGLTLKIYRKKEYQKIDPTSTGERLKKYLIQAAKMNPKTAKYLYLERTKYAEGGRIGKILGYITDKDVTAFIIKKYFIGTKYLVYVPVDLHTSLHQKNVIIHAVSISSAGGYLWAVPDKEFKAKKVFDLTANAFNRDLKRMMAMDIPQIEIEQIYEGITGFHRDKSFYAEDEEIEEPVVEKEAAQDDDF